MKLLLPLLICSFLSVFATSPLFAISERGARVQSHRTPAPAETAQEAIHSEESDKSGKSVSLLSRIFSARAKRNERDDRSQDPDNADEVRASDPERTFPVRLNGRSLFGRNLFRSKSRTESDGKIPAPKDLDGTVKQMDVRVTVYWQHGSGTDRWTAAGKTSSGRPLRCRQTAAVDPAVIPYGSKILLPEAGKFLEAVDTGSAVKSRKAARAMGRNVPVVDVFFENKQEALQWAHNHPHFMRAYVVAPE